MGQNNLHIEQTVRPLNIVLASLINHVRSEDVQKTWLFSALSIYAEYTQVFMWNQFLHSCKLLHHIICDANVIHFYPLIVKGQLNQSSWPYVSIVTLLSGLEIYSAAHMKDCETSFLNTVTTVTLCWCHQFPLIPFWGSGKGAGLGNLTTACLQKTGPNLGTWVLSLSAFISAIIYVV